MFDWLKNIINYPIIETEPVWEQVEDQMIMTEPGFILSPLNLIIFLAIYLIAKIFLKYLKKSYKLVGLTGKQLEIEGRRIAVWKLTKQVTYVLVLFLCIVSLQINNDHIDYAHILEYRFIGVGEKFHIAVYHIFLIVIVVFITRLVLSVIKLYIHRNVSKRENFDPGTEYIYTQLAKYFIYSVAILSVLRSFGADMELFIGALTIIGVGFALGVQNIVKDYMSGILLLFEGHVKVGDVIEVQNMNGDQSFIAEIKKINLRTSTVETRESKILIIPNAQLTHERVINWSMGDRITRFSIPVTVKYGSDLETVKTILLQCVKQHPKVLKTKEPIVRLLNFGNHGLEMDILFWANQNLFIEIHKSEIRFTIDEEFRKHNIVIPFEQADLHLDQEVIDALKGKS